MSTEITDPEVLAFIAKTESAYPLDTIDLTLQDQRRIYDQMSALFRVARPVGISVTDGDVAGVPTRSYQPANPRLERVIYCHGGGFLVGGLESHDDVCAEIAEATGCPVISVDYRLCPEHVHPAAYDDALAVTQATVANGPVILAGDSAGGNLVAAVAQTLKAGDIRGQVLIYPGLGGDMRGLASYDECAEAPMLTIRDIRFYRDLRAGGPPPEGDPTFFPLVATDLTGVAPCFISAAGVDPLRDDGVEYARRLSEAGVRATCAVEAQLPHGHLRARHMSRRASEAFGRIVAAVAGFAEDAAKAGEG